MDDRIIRAIIGALRERDRSGHEIWQWLGPTHGANEELTEATLYPTLYELEAERLIDSYWLEGERIRRVYRIAGKGVLTADKHGWRTLARVRTENDPILTPGLQPAAEPVPRARKRATASRATALAVGAGDAGVLVAGGGPEIAADAEPAPTQTAQTTRRRKRVAAPIEETGPTPSARLSQYVEQVSAALRLSEPHRSDVRHELRDHLEDCQGELVGLGLDASSAATEAMTRLGTPDVLAKGINAAQLTRRRLLDALRAGASSALFAGSLSLAAAGSLVFLVPYLSRALIAVTSIVGLHLYAPETSVWRAQSIATAAVVAAFVAARQSTPRIATRSRRSVRIVRPAWAAIGAIPLLVLALLLPLQLDLITTVTLLLLPVAFVAGTGRFQGVGDDPVSKRGIGQAALLLALLLFMPGFRVWAFDASAHSPAAPSPESTSARITWESSSNATAWRVGVTGLDLSAWTDPKIEFWPTKGGGVFVNPDSSATQPAMVTLPGYLVDLNRGSEGEWWVMLTATGRDGQRHTVATDVHIAHDDNELLNIVALLLRSR